MIIFPHKIGENHDRTPPDADDQFINYLKYFIPDYTQEIATNYGLTPAQARRQAEHEIADYLPEGVHTPKHILLCLYEPSVDDDFLVGYLWYQQDITMASAFIYDLSILPAYQGQGRGKQVLGILETKLKNEGVTQIKLRVAGKNTRARQMESQTGCRIPGINMRKFIG